MKKKMNKENGLTLVELLAAAAVLILLGLLLNAGLQMTVRSYRTITARSELELLLSTAVDALADDLRYAREVVGTGTNFTYTSDSYGANTSFALDEKGQIVANGLRVLPTGAYGSGGAYKVTKLAVTSHDSEEITFTIRLEVETAGGGIRAETPGEGVTVRCLNPKKDATGGGP